MSGSTSAGIRYPTGTDLLADTALWIRRLRDDVEAVLPKGPALAGGVTTVACNAGGDFTLNITTFSTLSGVVLEVITATGSNNAPTSYIRLHGLGPNYVTGRIHQQQQKTAGYGCSPLTGNVQLGWIAWGVPK